MRKPSVLDELKGKTYCYRKLRDCYSGGLSQRPVSFDRNYLLSCSLVRTSMTLEQVAFLCSLVDKITRSTLLRIDSRRILYYQIFIVNQKRMFLNRLFYLQYMIHCKTFVIYRPLVSTRAKRLNRGIKSYCATIEIESKEYL